MPRCTLRLSVTLGLWLAVAGALAQPAQDGPGWATLSAQQRNVLAPLQGHWAEMDANRRAKWLEVAARFPGLPQAEQQRVQERMARWASLSPAERGRARQSYQEARQLPAQERQARWEAYQALSPEQRRSLAQGSTGPNPPPAAEREGSAKRNLVGATPFARTEPRPVAPTVVQANPGVSTSLVNRPAAPPVHQQPGMPKIAATPGFVDRQTLLPRRGPQAAAASAPSR